MRGVFAKFLRVIEKHAPWGADLAPSVIVGVSGGADSMALLDALLRVRERANLTLIVAHYEHGIRGAEAKEDARFVEGYCRMRGIECAVEHGDVSAHAKEAKLSLETAARELRHAFLRRICTENGACGIVLAHHRDDQVETVLMHILRGAGMQGLKGMCYADGNVYRPLLDVTKEEIYAYCKMRAIPYREDATNRITDATRNKLRLELLPYVREHINAGIDDAVIRLSGIAREEDAFFDHLTEEAVRTSFAFDAAGEIACAQRQFFSSAPAALQRRCLRYVSKRIVGSDGWTYREIEAVRESAGRASGEKRLALAGDTEVYVGYRWIFLYKSRADLEKFADFLKEAENLNIALEDFPPCKEKKGKRESLYHMQRMNLQEGWNPLPFAGCAIEMTRVAHVGETDADTIYADGGMCRAGLSVRTRLPGDRIALPAGHRKVKELFIDGKVARSMRDAVPIVLIGEDILWVAGVRRSTLAYVTEHTKDIVRLKLLWEKSR